MVLSCIIRGMQALMGIYSSGSSSSENRTSLRIVSLALLERLPVILYMSTTTSILSLPIFCTPLLAQCASIAMVLRSRAGFSGDSLLSRFNCLPLTCSLGQLLVSSSKEEAENVSRNSLIRSALDVATDST